jgi:hypothetical protein
MRSESSLNSTTTTLANHNFLTSALQLEPFLRQLHTLRSCLFFPVDTNNDDRVTDGVSMRQANFLHVSHTRWHPAAAAAAGVYLCVRSLNEQHKPEESLVIKFALQLNFYFYSVISCTCACKYLDNA